MNLPGAEGLWLVKSLFSSLCTLHEDDNFVRGGSPHS
jgi:hypothetical protein